MHLHETIDVIIVKAGVDTNLENRGSYSIRIIHLMLYAT